MKKIFFLSFLGLLLLPASSIFAQNSAQYPAVKNTAKSVASDKAINRVTPIDIPLRDQSSKLHDLKTRADHEITRRIDSLKNLITKINSLKRLSVSQKTDLTSQIQKQIDGLTTLQPKIDADTDISTVRTDVKSIVTDYRIYAFFIQDINLISLAERIGTAIDNLTLLSGKLQTRITDAQSKGMDVSSLNTKYQDMQAKLSSSKALVDEVNSKLSGLNVSGYPANKKELDDSRTKLRQAFADLKTANQDSFEIIRILKELKLFPKLTPKLTPTPGV